MQLPHLDIYILNDQPTTCPHCSARTQWQDINHEQQLHTCPACACQFITTED